VPNFELGPKTKGDKKRIENVDEAAKYSWVKSPRWKGHAMEVGPLARFVIGYVKGMPEFKEPVDMVLGKLGVPITALFSTLGRTAARGLECSWAAHALKGEFNKLIANIKAGDTATANMATSNRAPGRRARRVSVSSRRRAARSRTGSTSRTRNQELPVHRADDLEREPA
jgi:Ni,Fe-hydrogenase I large subunit